MCGRGGREGEGEVPKNYFKVLVGVLQTSISCYALKVHIVIAKWQHPLPPTHTHTYTCL